MLGRNHSTISSMTALGALATVHPQVFTSILSGTNFAENNVAIAVTLAGGVLGAILPDLDLDSANITNAKKIIGGVIFRSFLIAAYTPLFFFSKKLREGKKKKKIEFTHRTYTHSLYALAVIFITSAAILFITSHILPKTLHSILYYFLFGNFVGYTFHIIADMTTYHGCPLLWPFSKKKQHVVPKFLRYRTGHSILEYLYVFTFVIVSLLSIANVVT